MGWHIFNENKNILHRAVKRGGRHYDAYLWKNQEGPHGLTVSSYNVWTGEQVLLTTTVERGPRLLTRANNALRGFGYQ